MNHVLSKSVNFAKSSTFSLFLDIYLLRLGYEQDFIGLMAFFCPDLRQRCWAEYYLFGYEN